MGQRDKEQTSNEQKNNEQESKVQGVLTEQAIWEQVDALEEPLIEAVRRLVRIDRRRLPSRERPSGQG